MKRLLSVLFWSVIAAAFIGPGTVTTAASAGAAHGLALLWALAFSTFACLVLQEAAGRLRLLSGRSLGQALSERFRRGAPRWLMMLLVVGAVLVGSAAYEAGNILGAVAGAELLTGWPTWLLTLGSALAAALLLWFNAPRRVAQLLGVVVAIMGVAFLWMAVALRPPPGEILAGLLAPSLPAGSSLLVLGLVGTTVVPYNLFLGSGLRRAEGIAEMRFGLGVAIALGGVISMAILVVGTRVAPPLAFERLAAALSEGLGAWGGALFAVGLLAAGLSSAITAPLASAITARGLAADGEAAPAWQATGWAYRSVWLAVLAVGLLSGLSGLRPVPAIIAAQALNGVLLPSVAIYLLVAVNDRRLMGSAGLNGWLSNLLMSLVTLVALLLGVTGVARAIGAVVGAGDVSLRVVGASTVLVALLGAVPLVRVVRDNRSGGPSR